MSVTALDIASLHTAYARGVAPAAVIGAVYGRISEINDPGIFIALDGKDVVLAAAAALPPFDPLALPLWGVPFAVKDNIDVAGRYTTAACPQFAYQADEHASVVARLVAAGALFIGKTNLDQFATGLVGTRTPYPVPRNAFDAARVPGGSSSGSAVAVAQGIVSFSLGTDTAGSGRVPAGLNHIVGLKPSLGLVSARGVVPACRTLDCVSIFAASVGDARRVFETAAAFDADDPFARRAATPAKDTLRRIGVPRSQDRLFFGDKLQEDAFGAALSQVEIVAGPVREVDMTLFFATARLLYDGPWVAERRAAIGQFMTDAPQAVHPVTRSIVEKADSMSAVDTFSGLYRLAELKRASEAMWNDMDVLVVPTAPIAPGLNELEADPIGPNSRLGTYTNFVNLLDLCALAIPGPMRADGFPAGITLIAPRDHDALLVELGQRLFPGFGGRRPAYQLAQG